MSRHYTHIIYLEYGMNIKLFKWFVLALFVQAPSGNIICQVLLLSSDVSLDTCILLCKQYQVQVPGKS